MVQNASSAMTVSARMAQFFIQLSDDMGVDHEQLIVRADIDPIWLESAEARMPVEALYSLTRQLATLSGTEDIGLWAGRANFLNQGSLL